MFNLRLKLCRIHSCSFMASLLPLTHGSQISSEPRCHVSSFNPGSHGQPITILYKVDLRGEELSLSARLIKGGGMQWYRREVGFPGSMHLLHLSYSKATPNSPLKEQKRSAAGQWCPQEGAQLYELTTEARFEYGEKEEERRRGKGREGRRGKRKARRKEGREGEKKKQKRKKRGLP